MPSWLTNSTWVLGGWQSFQLEREHNLIGLETSDLKLRAELRYGLVGLHTCGDLGPTILHLFNQVEDTDCQGGLDVIFSGCWCWSCCKCWLLLHATQGTLSNVQVTGVYIPMSS